MLNILSPNVNDTVVDGLMSALAVAGHNCTYINPGKAAFDAFYETRPDILICYAKDYVDRFDAPLDEFKNTKCVLLKTNKMEERVLGYTPKPAANLAQYGLSSRSDSYESEFAYINLTKQNEILNNFLEAFMWPNFNPYLKVYGEKLPYSSYLGSVDIKQICSVLSSTDIFLTLYNDLLLEACWHGCLCIPYRSNPDLIPEDIFDRADNIEELKDKLSFWIRDKKHNIYADSTQRKWILDGNTYYDRASQMLHQLGFIKESEECSHISKGLKT